LYFSKGHIRGFEIIYELKEFVQVSALCRAGGFLLVRKFVGSWARFICILPRTSV
jgi:hypothetical protein